jgi:hypothetical protein
MMPNDLPIHVHDGADGDEPARGWELPVLTYRTFNTTRNPFPDGWVLSYMDSDNNGVDEYIVGAWDLDVDEAVTMAQDYLISMGVA